MNPFTQIDNIVLQDDRLSYGATGLLAYMLSMPGDWKFNLQDLAKRKKDKRFKTRQLLKELESFRMVRKQRITDKQGKVRGWSFVLKPEFDFLNLESKPESNFRILDNSPSAKSENRPQKPESNLPEVEKTRTGKLDTTNKTEEQKKHKNKEEGENPTPKKSFKQFSIEDFTKEVNEAAPEKNMPEAMKAAFLDYWTEKSPSGTMKFQLESTWETGKRIATWIRNQARFDSRRQANNGLAVGQKIHTEAKIKWRYA